MGHRKTRRVYDKELTFENVFAAWKKVSQTCQNRRGVFEFGLFTHARVMKILKELKERKYWPNRFRCFMIFEPKPRLVMSQSIKDKVVNHFVAARYLIPLLERTLIDTNVATREGMGAKKASERLERYVSQMQEKRPRKPIFVLKVDVSKFFYRIDHQILMAKLERQIKDKDVLEILRRIIEETDKPYINKVVDKFNKWYGTDIPHYEKGKGLSIGAVVSQFLAIYYLSDLDRYIKEELKCLYFVRYMDDLIILGWDKAELHRLKGLIEMELKKLKLEMNPKSAVYKLSSETGFPFLGYRYYMRGEKLRVAYLAGTVRRVRKRLGLLKEHNPDKYERSYEAYRGYFKNALPERGMEEVVGEK